MSSHPDLRHLTTAQVVQKSLADMIDAMHQICVLLMPENARFLTAERIKNLISLAFELINVNKALCMSAISTKEHPVSKEYESNSSIYAELHTMLLNAYRETELLEELLQKRKFQMVPAADVVDGTLLQVNQS